MYLKPSKHVLYIVGSLQNCDKYFTSGSHSCVRLINKYEKGSFVASMQILIRKGLKQKNNPSINIYIEDTKDPFSYLFLNLTQECEPEVKQV